MAKAIVIYYSRTGNTRKMAEIIAQAIREEGVDCLVKDVQEMEAEELLD